MHVLLALPGSRNLSEVMRDIKANSSRHMRELGVRFAWQDGYAAVSVSPSQIHVVKRYIAIQKEHHRKCGFEEELVILLERAVCGDSSGEQAFEIAGSVYDAQDQDALWVELVKDQVPGKSGNWNTTRGLELVGLKSTE